MRRNLASIILFSSILWANVAEAKTQPSLQVTQLPTAQSVSDKVDFLNGVWEGTYTCSQGLTELRLIIEAKSTTDIDVVFLFSAHPSNPNVPSGRFRMEGLLEVFDSPDIPSMLELKATTWINRPGGYSTVDLLGDVSLSERRLTGSVYSDDSICTTFDALKSEN